MKEIAHSTHHDLDAVGCMLHLDYATPKAHKTTFSTNYRDIEEKVSDVYDFCTRNNPDLLVISDVSFANNKSLLYKLQSLDISMVFIDHHEYPEGFFDDISIPYHHDIAKSATKISQEVFRTKGKNKNLDILSDLINNYDIWVSSAKSFPVSIAINDYFWEIQNEVNSLDIIMQRIKDVGYNLPNFSKWYIDYQQRMTSTLKKNYDKKLIMSDNFFCAAFVDDFFNEILYKEFAKGTSFVMIANSYGIVRYRFRKDCNLTRRHKELIKMRLIGTLENGHLNAFSDKIQNHNFNKIMDKVKEVHNIVQQYKG